MLTAYVPRGAHRLKMPSADASGLGTSNDLRFSVDPGRVKMTATQTLVFQSKED